MQQGAAPTSPHTSQTMMSNKPGKLLQHGYTFWYMRRGNRSTANKEAVAAAATKALEALASSAASPAKTSTDGSNDDSYPSPTFEGGNSEKVAPVNPYENSIKTIATIETAEEFWSVYDWLIRPNELPTTTDYHFFRSGIKPTWEDPSNIRGGKWIVRLKKGLASRYWEEIILAMIGMQLQGAGGGGDEICGAVCSIRYNEDIVSVWNKSADNRDATDRIRDSMKKILRLPPGVHMEYKPHQASLADKSSFRNTTVYRPAHAHGGSTGSSNSKGAGNDILRTSSGGIGPSPSSEGRDMMRRGSWGERDDNSGGVSMLSGNGSIRSGSIGSKHKRETERAWR